MSVLLLTLPVEVQFRCKSESFQVPSDKLCTLVLYVATPAAPWSIEVVVLDTSRTEHINVSRTCCYQWLVARYIL